MDLPRSMIEAGARALYFDERVEDFEKERAEKENWFAETGHRHAYLRKAEAAIRAAIGCAEVVRTNDTKTDEIVDVQTWCEESVGDVCPLHPGDTIIIVRAEKGGGNG